MIRAKGRGIIGKGLSKVLKKRSPDLLLGLVSSCSNSDTGHSGTKQVYLEWPSCTPYGLSEASDLKHLPKDKTDNLHGLAPYGLGSYCS